MTSTAKSGHRSSHILQQIQSSGLSTTAFSLASSSKTFLGQKLTQIPQPLHHSLLIISSLSFFFAMKATSSIEVFVPGIRPQNFSADTFVQVIDNIQAKFIPLHLLRTEITRYDYNVLLLHYKKICSGSVPKILCSSCLQTDG